MRPHRIVFAPGLSILLAGLLLPSLLRAGPSEEWDPVAPEDLALATSKIEPGAGAEAIFWRMWVQDEFAGGDVKQSRDSYVRIKVFTEQAAQQYSKLDIDYPMHGVVVRDISARTIKPDGSIVALDRRGIVEETVVKRRGQGIRRKSFAMPAVGPGCIVEYRYREVRSGVAADVFDLQRDIPIQKLSYFVKPLSLLGWSLRQMRFHTAAVSSNTPVDGWYETSVVGQRAYTPEPFGPPEYQQRGWLLQYYTDERLGSPERFWSDFAHTEADWFDGYVKPDKKAIALAEQVTSGATTDEERVRMLAEWLQRAFLICRADDPDSLRAAGLVRNTSLSQTLRQRGGTYFDADMAFAGLVRALGMQARLVRVASSLNWFFDKNMMDGAFLPSYQVGVRLGGSWRTFDPATRYLAWDMLPWDEEGQLALLCDADSARFVETQVANPERSQVTREGTLTVGEDGTVEGDLTLSFSGHLNEDYRRLLEGVPEADRDTTLLHELDWQEAGVHVSNIELRRGADERQPLVVQCHVRLPEFATVTGKRIILEPSILHAHAQAPFTASVRHTPVCFNYAWSERDSLLLNVPEGWTVAAVDALGPVNAPGVAGYDCQSLVSDDRRRILYLRSLHIGDCGSTYFPAKSYPEVKRLFDWIQERDHATVTLTRVEAKP